MYAGVGCISPRRIASTTSTARYLISCHPWCGILPCSAFSQGSERRNLTKLAALLVRHKCVTVAVREALPLRTPTTCDTSGARRLEGPARVLRCTRAREFVLLSPVCSSRACPEFARARLRSALVGGRGVTLRGSLKYQSSSRGSGALRRAALAARR